MSIKENIQAFGERLEDVFGEDLSAFGWKLKKYDRVGTDENPVVQAYFTFIKNDDSGEVNFLYDIKSSLTAVSLIQRKGGDEVRYGQDSSALLFSRDKAAIDTGNEKVIQTLPEKEIPVYNRILHYFTLKAPENIF
ncbi:MAG: hypothetical protein HPY53_09510 [Brevinematales bacterium]|nr:hypothetical protein [Brevinematales bacterium]